jgi:hypothetical protein
MRITLAKITKKLLSKVKSPIKPFKKNNNKFPGCKSIPHLTLNYPNHLLIYPIQPNTPKHVCCFQKLPSTKEIHIHSQLAVCKVVVNKLVVKGCYKRACCKLDEV